MLQNTAQLALICVNYSSTVSDYDVCTMINIRQQNTAGAGTISAVPFRQKIRRAAYRLVEFSTTFDYSPQPLRAQQQGHHSTSKTHLGMLQGCKTGCTFNKYYPALCQSMQKQSSHGLPVGIYASAIFLPHKEERARI